MGKFGGEQTGGRAAKREEREDDGGRRRSSRRYGNRGKRSPPFDRSLGRPGHRAADEDAQTLLTAAAAPSDEGRLAGRPVRFGTVRPPRRATSGPVPPRSRHEFCCLAALGHHTTAGILAPPPIRRPQRRPTGAVRPVSSARPPLVPQCGGSGPAPGEQGEIFSASVVPRLGSCDTAPSVRWVALDASAQPEPRGTAPLRPGISARPLPPVVSAAYHTSAHFTGSSALDAATSTPLWMRAFGWVRYCMEAAEEWCGSPISARGLWGQRRLSGSARARMSGRALVCVLRVV